jgi:16S rRNA (adenine1518-N6/adenine1519-N6)-dimethyltransferase
MKRQRLGQHYLVDAGVVGRLISLAHIQRGERVLEIGTGRGALTRELCQVASRFDGYEVDKENYNQTLGVIGDSGARIHLADVFEERPKFDVLVSSLPYSRSASFIEWISQLRYDRAAVLLQEDFVMKILSPPGSRDYRAISVVAQASTEISVLDRVPRSAFSPMPKVNSVMVGIRPTRTLSELQVAGIKRLFALRRREVAAAVAKIGHRRLEGWNNRRVYSLSPDEVLALVAKLQS